MDIVVATGVVLNGRVRINAPSVRHVDTAAVQEQAAVLDAWERGRYAYFTALLDEGMEYEPSIEDDYEWIRRGC